LHFPGQGGLTVCMGRPNQASLKTLPNLSRSPVLISLVLPIRDGRIADMALTLPHCHRRLDEADLKLKEPNLE
jgi:hypothetical protein